MRMRSYEAAELILKEIEESGGAGLNMRMLLYNTGLTPGQYRSAYNWVFDNFGEPIWVKNYVGREWIYRLPTEERNTAEDWKRTISTQVTRAEREYNKIYQIAEQHPTVDNRLSVELARSRMEMLKIEKDRL